MHCFSPDDPTDPCLEKPCKGKEHSTCKRTADGYDCPCDKGYELNGDVCEGELSKERYKHRWMSILLLRTMLVILILKSLKYVSITLKRTLHNGIIVTAQEVYPRFRRRPMSV